MTKQRETRYVDPTTVLDVLRGSGRGMAWSGIAAQILGVDRKSVGIAAVRGVRDACYSLHAAGLVRKTTIGVYSAVEIA